MPTLVVVAGPNGCGKSTLTRTPWFSGIEVIDPDAIADTPGPAAREALRRRRRAISEGRTLAVETTLAGSGPIRLMDTARSAGYRIVLHYVCVDSPDQSLDRIRNRVGLGGHDIPEPDVRRRFRRSLENLPGAMARADEVVLYDNTDPDLPHREVAIFAADVWWTDRDLPDWAATAVALAVPPRR